MQEIDDDSLLRQYAEQGSSDAFAAIISRHIDKVYSVALRHTGNRGQAEEITQAVFVVLAGKANSLSKQIVLSGWLYQTARLTSLTFSRTEIRRAQREQEAYMQNVSNEAVQETWIEIAPLLDSAMASLNKTDRQAVLLRFFDGKSLAEVGAALGTAENAARMRVSRALEKLRHFFAKHGVRSTTDIIAGVISSNCVQNAPPTLAQAVAAAAMTKSAATTGSTLGLVKGVLKAMAWAKAKTAAVAGSAAVALALGAGYYFGWLGSDHVELATFQNFINGRVPVKEAVVYRQFSDTNGTILNKEWWRFGYQDGAWFVQRLVPDATDSTNLVPVDSTVCGASFTQFWVVSDQNLHIVDKKLAGGSVPDTFGSFPRSLMFSALSLGIPRESTVLAIQDAKIDWDGPVFKTAVASKWDKFGATLATATMTGKLTLSSNGLPTSAEYPGIGQYLPGSVAYEYGPAHPGIPFAFVEKFADRVFRYQFLSLTLGENKRATSDGYVPSLFADMKIERIVKVYTNDLAYELRNGKTYPSFSPPAPKIGERPPPLRGSVWFNTTDPLTLDDLRGNVILLDFSSSSCVPCIEELPRMEAVYNEFKNHGLIVIGVWSDWGTAKRVSFVLKRARVTFPNMMDVDLAIADYKTGSTSWSYALDANPSYVLVDKSGKLVWKSTGGIPPSESQISGLLDDAKQGN